MIRILGKIPRSYYIFGIFILLFCGLFTAVELINHKLWTNDFKVYYEAVNDFFRGGNPYGKQYGLDTGYFKYPPFTLYLFSGYALVPYWAGQLIHLSILAAGLIISVPLLKDIVQRTFSVELSKKQTWILYVTFLCVAIHLTREFHMGNVNLILLLCFVLGLNSMDRGDFRPAVFWSLMVILKPIMILAFVPLAFYRKWKLIAYMAGFGIFFFIFPVIHIGWSGNMALWSDWFQSIAAHGEYIVSENSLTYLTNHYLGISSAWWPSVICLLLLVGIMCVELYRNGADNHRLITWTIIFTAFTPNFFVTDTEHFLLSIPLLVFLLYFLSNGANKYYWIGFAIAAIPFSLNSNDLLGRDFSDYLDAQGALGIGNMFFIITVLFIRTKFAVGRMEKTLS